MWGGGRAERIRREEDGRMHVLASKVGVVVVVVKREEEEGEGEGGGNSHGTL